MPTDTRVSSPRLRVLALASYPVEAASTRFRIEQLRPALAAQGVDVEIHPFIDAVAFGELYDRSAWRRTAVRLAGAGLRRLGDAWRAPRYDCVLVQREAMLFGPPVIEWLARRRGRVPLVLDLDDATYIAYDSPVYGRLARTLKWPGKTDALIAMANVVTCGNRVLADYAAGLGASTELVPTVVDTDRFVPRPTGEAGDPPVIGWIGNHDTFAYLEPLLPVLADVARRHSLRLRVVGSGRVQVTVPGVEVDNRQWRLETEVDDFQSLDVGLYPLADDARASGKSALKAIQYMAVGVPFVATPVGAAAQVGREGVTHLVATTPTEWRDALARLLADPALRRRLGDAGRSHALENWSLDRAAQPLAAALRRTAVR